MHTNILLHKATQPWPITLKDILTRRNVHHDSSVWNTAGLILFISIIYQRKPVNIDYFPICTFSITLSDANNRNSLGMALALMPPHKYRLHHTKEQRTRYIWIYTSHILTVFADIKLPEIDEVCDCCWQHCQVIIWHAQSVEYLAVEQLLLAEGEG